MGMIPLTSLDEHQGQLEGVRGCPDSPVVDHTRRSQLKAASSLGQSAGRDTSAKPRKRLPSSAPSGSVPDCACSHATREAKPPQKAAARAKSRPGAPGKNEETMPSSGHMACSDEDRAAKDKFLIDKRREGVPYKDIKKLGNFSEAESTLRGRLRTLTKNKEERVRKPEWTEIDVRRFLSTPSSTLQIGRASPLTNSCVSVTGDSVETSCPQSQPWRGHADNQDFLDAGCAVYF